MNIPEEGAARREEGFDSPFSQSEEPISDSMSDSLLDEGFDDNLEDENLEDHNLEDDLLEDGLLDDDLLEDSLAENSLAEDSLEQHAQNRMSNEAALGSHPSGGAGHPQDGPPALPEAELQSLFQQADQQVAVAVAETFLPGSEFTNAADGSIIDLKTSINQLCTLYINGKPSFKGKLLNLNGRLALKIVDDGQ